MQLGATTHDSFRKKTCCPFANSFPVCWVTLERAKKKRNAFRNFHLTPSPQPLGEEPIPALPMGPEDESYHELPSSESLQRFAKRVYCCVPFLLLSLVPFVLFYCILAKAGFCTKKSPKTPWKNKGLGHQKTRLFTIKTSKNVGFGGPIVETYTKKDRIDVFGGFESLARGPFHVVPTIGGLEELSFLFNLMSLSHY